MLHPFFRDPAGPAAGLLLALEIADLAPPQASRVRFPASSREPGSPSASMWRQAAEYGDRMEADQEARRSIRRMRETMYEEAAAAHGLPEAMRQAIRDAADAVAAAPEASPHNPLRAFFHAGGQARQAIVIFLTQEENQGVEQEVIDSRTVTVTMEDEAGDDSSSSSSASSSGMVAQHKCVVCLEDFQSQEELRVLPCFHRYHRGCIDTWLARNRHCPICKHDITG